MTSKCEATTNFGEPCPFDAVLIGYCNRHYTMKFLDSAENGGQETE